MQRAIVRQTWVDDDELADRRRHPLRSRLIDPPADKLDVPPPPIEQRIAPRVPAATNATTVGEPVIAASHLTAPGSAAPPHAVAKPSVHRPSMARRIGTAMLYGIAGFVLGAVFWHVVGFWDFVGQVMCMGVPGEGQITQAPPIVKLRDRAPTGAPLAVIMAPQNCLSLVLDRSNNATAAEPCDDQTMPLRSLKVARREDRWVTASQRIQQATSRGWSSSVKVETTATPRVEVQAAAD